MLGRLIAIKLMRKVERRQCTIKPRINDGTVERALMLDLLTLMEI